MIHGEGVSGDVNGVVLCEKEVMPESELVEAKEGSGVYVEHVQIDHRKYDHY